MTTNLSNFDKQWSDAHFLSFLFYYYCNWTHLLLNYFAFPREEERQKNLLNQFRLWKLLKRKHWNIVVTERAKKEMADQEQSMRRWWSFVWFKLLFNEAKNRPKGPKNEIADQEQSTMRRWCSFIWLKAFI